MINSLVGKHYFLLFWISLSLFVLEMISLKTARIVFHGGDIRSVLISLAITGVGVGTLIFYCIHRFRIRTPHYLLCYCMALILFLMPPYFFFHADFHGLGVVFFVSLFLLYTIIGVIVTEIFYENVGRFAACYAIHLIGLAAGVLFAVYVMRLGYLISATVLIFIGLGLWIMNGLPRYRGLALGTLFFAGFLLILGIEGGRIPKAISCSGVEGQQIGSRENLYSQVNFYKQDRGRFEGLINCSGHTAVLKWDEDLKKRLQKSFYTLPYRLRGGWYRGDHWLWGRHRG